MKALKLIILVIFITNFSQSLFSQRKQLFNNDWKFFRGTVNKAERVDFNDIEWRTVNLPHDWSIEKLPNQIKDSIVGPFSKASVGGAATGNTVGGEGWYRKTFVITSEQKNQRHELYFEGVYNQSEIWINGKKAYENVYGYTSFRFDITEFCNPVGQQNVVAVKVVNQGKNSRWYSGSGIYRHVWMFHTSKTYLKDWGTKITTKKVENNKAQIHVSATIIEGLGKQKNYKVKVSVINDQGQTVVANTEKIKVAKTSQTNVDINLSVNNPLLWSVENPYLYQIKLELCKGSKVVDVLSIPYGIRTIDYTVDKGFQLNGKTVLLKGGCVHHAHGLLGAAAFDDAEIRKVKLLKNNGYNAVRVAHNPFSESFMNACDSIGMLVIDEAFDQWNNKKNEQDYHLYFKDWSAKDIHNLIVRDKNHPSVIMWSIGNEIRERISEKGKKTALYLKNEILKYDTTRPITAGVNKYWNKDRTAMISLENAMIHLDVSGYNYMWRFYEEEHSKMPNRVMYGSESVATEASENWDKVEALPYVIGDFVWTAMDYLGESGIGNSLEVNPEENVHQFMSWPWYNGWCGDIDLIGVKKPQSYYRDVLWREKKISMAVELPVAEGKIKKVSFWGWSEETLSWTFPDMIGKEMKINVYSRAPKVLLYLNDKLIGEQITNSQYKAQFKVNYKEGVLKAVAVENGKEIATTVLKTIGEPSALKLTADKTVLKANGQSLSYVLVELVDDQGNVVVDDFRQISVKSQGVAQIIGIGNGAPADMESFGSLTPKLFNGRAMIILRSGNKVGETKIKVTSVGVKSSEISINEQ
ncbi:glycoside hydrolase family 2 TIM barrel-domain containing protein [Wenyingzhuangia sp. IMCC45467]